jgi:hypothetical protein
VSTTSLARRVRFPILTATLGIAFVASGCQTPQTATVAPPATGMIGQPAAYGSWATPPQGAAYPPTVSAPPLPQPGAAAPMPGPATQWQSAAPAAPAANSWSWSQPQGTAPGAAPPSIQPYGNQAQQFANQMQAQPQQYANQAQQYVNQQTQQFNNQMQQGMQSAQQQMNNQMQAAQQQVTAQMPTYQQPPTNTSWNPFATSAQSLPPARATPTVTVPRY